MANKQAQYNTKTSSGYDSYHFETDDEMVLCDSGTKTLKAKLSDVTTAMETVSQQITGISGEISGGLQQTLGEVNNKSGNESDASTKATLFGRIKQAYEHLTTNLPTARANKIDNLDAKSSDIKAKTDLIGASGDTANASGTTLFAIIKYVAGMFTGTWTSALATAIGTTNSNVTAIKAKTDLVGATGDTGGSTTAGSVLGKLNKLITDLSTALTNITSIKTNTDKLASGTAIVSAVKSVQRGTSIMNAESVKITISSINPSKAHVSLWGVAARSSTGNRMPYIGGLTSTILTIMADSYDGSPISWEIVEYY